VRPRAQDVYDACAATQLLGELRHRAFLQSDTVSGSISPAIEPGSIVSFTEALISRSTRSTKIFGMVRNHVIQSFGDLKPEVRLATE